MIELNENFWEERYFSHQTGWDIGHISTPIKEYVDQLNADQVQVLIPGAGNAYEAEYLWNKGFRNIDVLDLALAPLENLKNRIPEWPESQLIHKDFFDHQGSYDLIIEQTFFCALNPKLRQAYIRHMKNLLKPNGKLVGLLFNIPLNAEAPPFGGNEEEYKLLFKEHFKINKMETAYNSIPPRQGNELWVSFSPLKSNNLV